MAFLSGWDFRRKITIDSTQVSSDLTNYPLLVSLSGDNLDFSNTDSNGIDIRFTDIDGTTLLDFEREIHVTSNSLVSHYKLNDNSATTVVLDDIGSNNGTSVQNTSTMTTTGKINSALKFNGTSDEIDCGNSTDFQFTNRFSFFAWIKITNNGTRDGIVTKYLITGDQRAFAFNLGTHTGGINKLRAMFGNTTTGVHEGTFETDSNILSTGIWYHVGVVYDGTQPVASDRCKLYVDGVEQAASITASGNSNIPDNLFNSTQPLKIGSYDDFKYFDGDIDDVRIYNKSLKQSEIDILYNSGTGTEITNNFVGGGEGIYWVKVPSVTSAINKEIYVYYGNVGAVEASNPNAVWDTNYKGVWHLKESGNGTTDEFSDSTSNNHHGTGGNGVLANTPTQSPAKIGNGQDFDGAGDYIAIPDHTDWNFGSGDLTISAWVNFDNISGNQNILGQPESGSNYFYMALESGANFRFRDFTGSNQINFITAWPGLATGVDYHITVVRNAGSFTYYINGVSIGTSGGAAFTDRSQPLQIGGHTGISYYVNGKVDEVRISTGIDRGTSWMGADIAATNTILNTFGVEEVNTVTESIQDINTDIRVIISETIDDINLDMRVVSEDLIDINTDIRVKHQEAVEDINVDIRISEESFNDINTDIRALLSDQFEDINLDVRVKKEELNDIDLDIRIKHQEIIDDMDTDISVRQELIDDINSDIRIKFQETIEDINTDIRVDLDDTVEDINTDIRISGDTIADINTNITISKLNFYNIASDIRYSVGIVNTSVSFNEPAFIVESPYTDSVNVIISMDGIGNAATMRFKNESGGVWSAWETFAITKEWALDSGDGLKKVHLQFRDVSNRPTGEDTIIVETTLNTVPVSPIVIQSFNDVSLSTPILDSTYQSDNDPFFRWEVPVTNIAYSGFSYELDGAPNSNIDIDMQDIVISGINITKVTPLPEMTINVSSGNYYFLQDIRSMDSSDILINNGGALDRIDVLYISGVTGGLVVQEGAEAITPVVPELIDNDNILLAEIYIPAGTVLVSGITITDVATRHIVLDRYLSTQIPTGQHILSVTGIDALGNLGVTSNFNIWIANTSPNINNLLGYTSPTKIIAITNGIFQTASSSVYLEWDSAPSEPGPIRYYYTVDGSEPTLASLFTTNTNITLGSFSEGVTTIKIKPFDNTTGNSGDTNIFQFVYGVSDFTDDIVVISGGTILKQSLKQVRVSSVSWNFDSARICNIIQPVAFDSTVPLLVGNDITVVYGDTTIFFGKIRQIERTIDIGSEAVSYNCTGPRGELIEEFAFIESDSGIKSSRLEFDREPLSDVINSIVNKFPSVIKNVDSFPTGNDVSDKFVGQTVSTVLDNIYDNTKFGWYIKPNGHLVSIDSTVNNPGQAKFGIYGTTVNSITPQYNVMSANLQFDVTNRYNKVIIEGAKKRILLSNVSLRCASSNEIKGLVNEDIDKNKLTSEQIADIKKKSVGKDRFRYYTYTTNFEIVKLLQTWVSFTLAHSINGSFSSTNGISNRFSSSDYTIANRNNAVRTTTIRKPIFETHQECLDRVNGIGFQLPEFNIGGSFGSEPVDPNKRKIKGTTVSIKYTNSIISQGTLSSNNIISFSSPMYSNWGGPRNPFVSFITIGVGTPAFGQNQTQVTIPKRTCASVQADLLIETDPFIVEVATPGTADSVSKTYRIVKNDFRFSEDPDDPRDDTIKMQEFGEDFLAKLRDIKIQGAIVLDTIDISWDLDKTVNLINTAQGSWTSINAKVVGISFDFNENTTTLEITTEFLK